MITVSWYDFDAQCERWGKLLQVCPNSDPRDHEHLAFVIVDWLASDRGAARNGHKIVVPVSIGRLRVHGVQDAIPVLGHHQAKEHA